MTTWPARLRGDRILCGWTVNGRANCGAELATIEQEPTLPRVRFWDIYEQEAPPVAGEPTRLRIGTYAAAKLSRGQTPARRRPDRSISHGAYTVANPEHVKLGLFLELHLPVVAPCINGHMNIVDADTLNPP
jgi:hypothetical protein